MAQKASSQSLISCASRVGLLTWQRRPRATRTTAHPEPAIHPHLNDRLRPAQPSVRHPHLLTLRLGFHASATPVPQRLAHRIDHHRTRRHARPAHQPALLPKPPWPGPAAVIYRHRCHHEITLPYSPLAGPLGLTAVPAWILAALARLTAFYVITNEGPNIASHLITRSTNPASTVASDELMAQHTTLPAAFSEPAFSARHARRESTRGRMRRPSATRGFAQPGHGPDHHRLWLPRLAP